MNQTAAYLTKQRTPIPTHRPSLKVIGLGGGGCNAVNRMIELGLSGIDFIGANTDHQALKSCLAPTKIHLGPRTTRGLGAGGNPKIGQAAAEESRKELERALAGADMVFLTAGMGGGTGTGSISVAARIAREMGAVTIAVVTTPFTFEMGRRQRSASEGLALLRPYTDTLISIPNDRLLFVADRKMSLDLAFRLADDVLRQGVQGITELITESGLINVDFSHVVNIMKLGGGALMAIGQGSGENKAMKAVEQALHHPLLETTSLEDAKGILVNITAGSDLGLFEVQEALNYLQGQSGNQADIVFGVTEDPRWQDRAQVILIVTGLGAVTLEETISKISRPVVEVPLIIEDPVEDLHDDPVDEYTPEPPVSAHPLRRSTSSPASTNLDLPAFLRKGR
jgi:cell division protein FtsZ